MVCLAPRALGDSVRPRRSSGVVVRPLNFTVRSRVLTVPFIQALSKAAEVLTGVVLLTVGAVAAWGAAVIPVASLRAVYETRDAQSLEMTVVAGLLAPCGAVFCTAGYRLLFRSSETARSMLPRALWLALSVFFGALVTFSLGALVFAPPQIFSTMVVVLLSSTMMGSFSVACYGFARRVGKGCREGAASNNRWSGP